MTANNHPTAGITDPRILRELRVYMEGEGLAKQTISNYMTAARRAHAYATERGWDLLALTREQADELFRQPKRDAELRQALLRLWEMYDVVGPKVWRRQWRPDVDSHAETLDEYGEYLVGLGLAPATVRNYRSRLAVALNWATANNVALDQPSASDLADLRDEYTESHSMLRQAITALQHWWDLIGSQNVPAKAFRVPAKPRPHYRGLEPAEASKLAEAAVGWHPEGTATLIALYTALRRTEIAAMRWDRFTPDLEWYTVLGKGNRTDTIPIHPYLRALLRQYRSGYPWLFPGTGRLHVHPTTVWDWVNKVADVADVAAATHRLRHTAIQAVYVATRDIRVAQAFARHARLDTTQIYTAVDPKTLADAVKGSLNWIDPATPLRLVT